MMKKQTRAFWSFLLPSLIGVLVFVFLPFGMVIRQSVTTVTTGKMVGLTHFKTVLENPAFQIAVKNTLIFTGLGITGLVALGLLLALAVTQVPYEGVYKALLLFPLAIPTATVVVVWKLFFYQQNFSSLIISFLWKNIGYSTVLWYAGLKAIPSAILEAAAVDGASKKQSFWYVVLPNLRGSLYLIMVLALFYSFKIYREVYLVAGAYPKQEMYLMQHLFQNWYMNLELDKLSAASVMVGTFLFVVITLLHRSFGKESDW